MRSTDLMIAVSGLIIQVGYLTWEQGDLPQAGRTDNCCSLRQVSSGQNLQLAKSSILKSDVS